MRQALWDAFDDNYSGNMNENLYPFIDHKNEKECLRWLVQDIEGKFRSRQSRLEMLRRLDAMFKGASYTGDHRKKEDDDIDFRRPSSIYNFICEMVEAKVAQRSRFKPAVTVIPSNVDLNDENRADSAKMLLMAKSQEMDFESIFANGDKINFLSGQSYTYVKWNKSIGGENKKYAEYKNMGVTLEYEDGEVIPSIMNGDIDILVLGPDRVYEQLGKKRWCDVDDVSIIEWVHVDELKAMYPEKANDIRATDSIYTTFFSSEERSNWNNHCMVIEYYHKPTMFFEGAYVKFTPSCILEKTAYPYAHKKLPIVYDTDIDVQGEITGRPFTANIEKLQRLHDMISASTARGYAIACSPKWVYAKGSIDPNKLTNQYSSLEFKGPQAPILASFNGVPSGSLDLMQWTEKGIEKSSSVYGISRGEAPKGIKAAVALQFLDEQELQRESRGMAKRQRRIIETYTMTLSLAQQFYTPEDGRIFKYLGEDNQNAILDFKSMDITGSFDIRIENSSALPDSKTGKIAAILDINTATQADPMFDKQSIAQMLDLGNDRRFRQQNTAGLKAAQYKLSLILNKQPAPEPQDFDDFIVEYPMFIQALRQRQYKGADMEVIQALSDYIEGMEYLMWRKSQMNPMFMQRVMTFNEYPIFYKVPIMPPMGAMGAPPQQAEQAIGPMKSQQEELKQQEQIINS